MIGSVILAGAAEHAASGWLENALRTADVGVEPVDAAFVPPSDDDRLLIRHTGTAEPPTVVPRGRTGVDVRCDERAWSDDGFLTAVDGVLWTLPDAARHRLAALARVLVRRPGRVVAVLPRLRFPNAHMVALLDMITHRFAHFGAVSFCVAPDIRDHVVRLLGDGASVFVDPSAAVGEDETVRAVVYVDCPDLGQTVSHYLGVFPATDRHYVFTVDNQNTYLKILKRDGNSASLLLDVHSQPQYTDHHLSRTLLGTGGTVVKFAFGSLQIMSNEIGPVDALGFRIGGRFEQLATRKDNHRVIAFFGGSAAFGWRCFHDRMFTSLLERSLNDALRRNGAGLSVSVLNFAISGHSILDEIRSFVLFAHAIRPDIVVSHGGFNDFFYGSQIDPQLVERYGFIYCHVHDQVIRTAVEPLSDDGARTLVDAYVGRLSQFGDIVRGNGGTFVYGRQPIWAGKPLTAEEAAGVQHWLRAFSGPNPTGDYRHMMNAVMYLYPRLRERLNTVDTPRWLDAHAAVAAHGNEDVFFDPVHMTARGHELTARFYHDHLLEALMQRA